MIIGPKRLEQAVEKASKAFWTFVQEEFPHLNPENLDIGTVMVLQWQMKESIERYLQNGEDEDGRI